MSSGWGLFTMRKECERKWTQEQVMAKKNLKYLLFMRHEEKEGKLSDFLCSHSNAVLVRSRSHYLCIRKNLSARRPSRVNIQIKKWTRHHRSPNIEVRLGRALLECSLTSLNAYGFSLHKRHEQEVQPWHGRLAIRICMFSTAARSS